MADYRCRGDDHEDLTDKVRDAIIWRRGVFRLFSLRKPQRWKVIVKCSHGHENVFTGSGRPS